MRGRSGCGSRGLQRPRRKRGWRSRPRRQDCDHPGVDARGVRGRGWRHRSRDGVRSLDENGSYARGRADHLGRESLAQRARLLRRQGLHQPGDPVRGAPAAGDLARRLPAAGLRRALRQGRREPGRPLADERLPGALRPAGERRDGRRGGRRGPRDGEQRRRAVGARRPAAARGVRLQLRAPAGANDEGRDTRLLRAEARPIPTSAASPTAATKRSSWRSAIPRTSTGSSPGLPPTTGRRSPACSSHGSPR